MPSLKDLKNRIVSVTSTRKITSAMKMVAASKFRRAQEQAESSRPYAQRMARMMTTLAGLVEMNDNTSRLLTGTGKAETILLIVMTADRGLCGAFNSSVVRETRRQIAELEEQGKKVLLACVGRKGRDLLKREHGKKMAFTMEDVTRKAVSFSAADALATKLTEMYAAEEFDVAHIVFNRFHSVISQVVTVKQLIPIEIAVAAEPAENAPLPTEAKALCEIYEPGKEQILNDLLPRNISVQLYSSLLESAAGEQGARMTAMDNATRNAGDMIDRLTLNYNRSRQAAITSELIEIISGAEAV
jgi:F-type H+-transporting ATPase subunit gamma